MVPTEEARMTRQMLYSALVPAAIASTRVAMHPPVGPRAHGKQTATANYARNVNATFTPAPSLLVWAPTTTNLHVHIRRNARCQEHPCAGGCGCTRVERTRAFVIQNKLDPAAGHLPVCRRSVGRRAQCRRRRRQLHRLPCAAVYGRCAGGRERHEYAGAVGGRDRERRRVSQALEHFAARDDSPDRDEHCGRIGWRGAADQDAGADVSARAAVADAGRHAAVYVWQAPYRANFRWHLARIEQRSGRCRLYI